MENKPAENELLKPDHELPAPHDMQLDPGYDDELPSGASAPKSAGAKRSFPLWILPLIAFLLVALASGMYFMNMQKEKVTTVPEKQPTVAPTMSPTPVAVLIPTLSPEETKGWRTYTDQIANYSVLYPSTIKLLDDDVKDGSITFIFPEDEARGSHLGPNLLLSVNYRNGTLKEDQYNGESAGIKSKPIAYSNVVGIMRDGNDMDTPLDYWVYPKDRESPLLRITIRNLYPRMKEEGDTVAGMQNLDSKLARLREIASTVTFIEKKASASPTVSESLSICTREAKICPDGSSVGRTGPKCEFAACPK